jgi:L-asparaginase/Glu-tRNA(Gln) amidotransferase subunit D
MAAKIHLLTTGGTIAMQASDKGASLGAPPPFAAMLGRALPDVAIVVRPVLSKPSSGFSFADIADIAPASEPTPTLRRFQPEKRKVQEVLRVPSPGA